MNNLKYYIFYLIFCIFLLKIIKCQTNKWIIRNNEIIDNNDNDNEKKILNIKTLDNIVLPYAIGWSPENEWTMDPLRLKKWSTQLRYGKRAASAFRRSPWSSQVRFG
ncbi:hypothetical protein Mgra_00007865 [Meloidogyne graminicola]|uniref:Uncharacterized protein n=1 Tax=Meloidogyne graminicola TaxID=189291 RepID=A0A8S9ZHE3_9BILA|nr:hypothetical protein Mgra_00007865 [Meloidogyne graminicola]